MATESPAAYMQASSHSASLFRQVIAALFGMPQPGTLTSANGGVVNAGDGLVTQNGTPNMSVNVAGGEFVIPQTIAANGGCYVGLQDAPVNLAVSASDPTNPRIDTVVATVYDSSYAGAANNWVLQVVTGTPAPSPVPAAIPASSIQIAQFNVVAGATTILTANIFDARTFMLLGGQKIANNSDTGWITVSSFTNSWVAGSRTVQYRRQGNSVRVRGIAQSGTAGTIAFTLPAGFRPTVAYAVLGQSGTTVGTALTVDTGGGVTISATGLISLDAINFTID